MNNSPTRALAAFASNLTLAAIPPTVVAKAKELLLDYISHAVAVVQEDPARKLIRFAKAVGGPPESRILGTGLSVAAPWAALVNGTMGHMAELDDTHRGTMSHPGGSVWAAALAGGEEQGAARDSRVPSIRDSVGPPTALANRMSFWAGSSCTTATA